jgi:hypothetical protein
VFPLLGSGTGRGELNKLVDRLLTAAIYHCESNASGNIQCVYFLAWTDTEREACMKALARFVRQDRIVRQSRVAWQ